MLIIQSLFPKSINLILILTNNEHVPRCSLSGCMDYLMGPHRSANLLVLFPLTKSIDEEDCTLIYNSKVYEEKNLQPIIATYS